MTKFIAIISAKGGVGKTTTTINLTSALHVMKRHAIALDANFANPDLSVHLGAQNLKKTLHSALKGDHSAKEILYKHPSGIQIVPGSISYNDARKVRRENLINIIYGMLGSAEAVLIDSTPGMGIDARTVIRASDYVIIVTTPDLVSVTGSLKMVKLAVEMERTILGVVVNKVREAAYELVSDNIADFLGIPVIGVIPEEDKVRMCLKTKTPIVFDEPYAKSTIGYKKLAGMLIGQKYEEELKTEEEKSLFASVLENLGFKRFK